MKLRRHLTFSNVIAVLALFVALGGGAYAAHVAKKNSVTSRSIKNGAVTSADVKDNGLTGKDIADSSLSGTDVDDGSIRSADIADGSVIGSDVADSSVTGADVADGSISADDIQLASLGDATSGRTKLGASAGCISTSATFASCLADDVQIGRSSRILAIGNGSAGSDVIGGTNRVSTCALFVDGQKFSADVTVTNSFPESGAMTVTAVTPVLNAGTRTIDFRCHSGSENSKIAAPTLTTVVLGNG